jgi:pyridoxamine 5'-phosphate oxidase family protein
MSVFTEAEIAYLQRQTLGRLGTVGADGQPHLIPITFHYDPEADAIDIGGIDFGNGKKWRDMMANERITFLVDDTSVGETGPSARALEIRGLAELHLTGGGSINPRFPHFDERWVRLRPRRIVAWGIDAPGMGPDGLLTNARDVG